MADNDAQAQMAQLAKLREPFPANQVSKLPKPTKQQTEEVKADFKKGVRCTVCGSWHHPQVVHLDYVGHAAITDRLLNVDPYWSWEPLAFRDGLPAFDGSGGLWIKLTVCGVTRLGYGHAAPKNGQDPGAREKEVIGDALRNAGMRFGAALDLWHKGDLHADPDDAPGLAPATQQYEQDRARPKTAANGVKRLSSAEAKRAGVHTKIDNAIEGCADEEAIDLLEADFDLLTAECPISWLDAIRNKIILKREEVHARTAEYGAEFDQAFAGTVGPRQGAPA